MSSQIDELKAEIAEVKETIRLRWVDMDRLPMSPDERGTVRGEIDGLITYLQALLEKRDDA